MACIPRLLFPSVADAVLSELDHDGEGSPEPISSPPASAPLPSPSLSPSPLRSCSSSLSSTGERSLQSVTVPAREFTLLYPHRSCMSVLNSAHFGQRTSQRRIRLWSTSIPRGKRLLPHRSRNRLHRDFPSFWTPIDRRTSNRARGTE